jgi:hypothetical protein
MTRRPNDERRAERHAQAFNPPAMPICPNIRRLWCEGYTAQQIAGIVRRPLSDVNLMTERMPSQARAMFNSDVVRRKA